MQLKLPKNTNEEEFVEIVNKIANQLCDKFKFGYYDRDDIRQECFIQAIDALDRYDSDKPLINFLWTHIHNRLCNLKRDKYFRLEKPCHKCPFNAYIKKTDQCTKHEDKIDCEPYKIWFNKNNSKQNIMSPIGISCVADDDTNKHREDCQILSNISNHEIINVIDLNVSIGIRKYWLQQKDGVKIPKKYYDLLMEEIHQILQDNNIDVS